MSISGKRFAVLFWSFACNPSIIDAVSSELLPMSRPLLALLASVEKDFTNLHKGKPFKLMDFWLGQKVKLTVLVRHSTFVGDLCRKSMYSQLDCLQVNRLV